MAGAVWLGDERGRDARSWKPSTPSARKRLTHLATDSGVRLNWRAAAFDSPQSTTARTIISRPLGVKSAFLRVSHSVLRESLRFGDISVLASNQAHDCEKLSLFAFGSAIIPVFLMIGIPGSCDIGSTTNLSALGERNIFLPRHLSRATVRMSAISARIKTAVSTGTLFSVAVILVLVFPSPRQLS